MFSEKQTFEPKVLFWAAISEAGASKIIIILKRNLQFDEQNTVDRCFEELFVIING